jgi:hypothetical protein
VWVARRRGAPLGSRETFFTLTLLSHRAIPPPPNQDHARRDILRRLDQKPGNLRDVDS